MTFTHYAQIKIGRMGAITTLSTVMMLTLAACGTPNSTVQPAATDTVPIIIQTVATATAAPVQTATSEVPAAVSTEPSDMAMGETPVVPDAIATGTAESIDMMDEMMNMTPSPDQPSTAIPTPANQSAGTATEIKGTLKEWAIDLSQSDVAAGTIRFVVTNEGQFTHNFVITDSSGKIAGTPNFGRADGEQIVEIDLAPGTYSIICDLPGHAARGQKTELVVK